MSGLLVSLQIHYLDLAVTNVSLSTIFGLQKLLQMHNYPILWSIMMRVNNTFCSPSWSTTTSIINYWVSIVQFLLDHAIIDRFRLVDQIVPKNLHYHKLRVEHFMSTFWLIKFYSSKSKGSFIFDSNYFIQVCNQLITILSIT